MQKPFSFARSIAAGAFTIGLGFGCATLGVLATTTPAYAQATLSATQIAAIQSSLQAALRTATTDAAKEAAIAQAIQSALGLYGGDTAASVTSVVMQTAELAGVSTGVIGTGIAQASAKVATTNVAAANSIATTIANEGDAAMRSSYQTASISLGYTNLASIAAQGPTVTGGVGAGGIGAGGVGGGATGGGAAGGGGGGCLNPSCTRL
jgi:hypothetical protein